MNEIKMTVVKFSDRPSLMLRYIDPVTRKVQHKSAKTRLKREADRAAAKWENELKEGIVNCGNVTWDDFRERYENEVLARYKDTTDLKAQGRLNALEKHLAPRFVRDITSDRLSHFQMKLREEGLAEATIKGHLVGVMAALRWGARIGLLAKVPKVALPKRAKASQLMKGRPITGEEFDRVLAAVPKVVGDDRAASWCHYLRGMYLSGLRLRESLELTWDSPDKLMVDFQPGEYPMFRIPAAHQKSNVNQLLPMAPEFAEFLMATPESQRTGYVFNLIARRKCGRRLGHYCVAQTVTKIGRKAGVKVKSDTAKNGTGEPDIKFASLHDFRRSFGERWSQRVMPPQLKELMRHESIETTMRYYVGRNAQSTAALLWAAHRQAKSNSFGNTASNGGDASTKENAGKQGVSQ